MPITKIKFDSGKLHSKVEDEIITFLKERKEGAFTSQEIMGGIHYHTEFSTPEISKMSTFAIADFTTLLHDLVRQGKIRMKIVRNRMYYLTRNPNIAECPNANNFLNQQNHGKWRDAQTKRVNDSNYTLAYTNV